LDPGRRETSASSPLGGKADSPRSTKIDPYSATMVWSYAYTLDPYGLQDDLPPELQQIGREYFLQASETDWAVLVWEVRALHPEICDEEWEELMAAARRGDTSFDPFRVFHQYGPPEVTAETSALYEEHTKTLAQLSKRQGPEENLDQHNDANVQ